MHRKYYSDYEDGYTRASFLLRHALEYPPEFAKEYLVKIQEVLHPDSSAVYLQGFYDYCEDFRKRYYRYNGFPVAS